MLTYTYLAYRTALGPFVLSQLANPVYDTQQVSEMNQIDEIDELYSAYSHIVFASRKPRMLTYADVCFVC